MRELELRGMGESKMPDAMACPATPIAGVISEFESSDVNPEQTSFRQAARPGIGETARFVGYLEHNPELDGGFALRQRRGFQTKRRGQEWTRISATPAEADRRRFGIGPPSHRHHEPPANGDGRTTSNGQGEASRGSRRKCREKPGMGNASKTLTCLDLFCGCGGDVAVRTGATSAILHADAPLAIPQRHLPRCRYFETERRRAISFSCVGPGQQNVNSLVASSVNFVGNSWLQSALPRVFTAATSVRSKDAGGRYHSSKRLPNSSLVCQRRLKSAVARNDGQKGGEFYTQSCIVSLIAEIIETYDGCILDLSCGSVGMSVSSVRLASEHKASPPSNRPAGHPSRSGRRDKHEGLTAKYPGGPSRELCIHGVESTDKTGRLC